MSKDFIPIGNGVYVGVEFLGDYYEGIALGRTRNKKFDRYTYSLNPDGSVNGAGADYHGTYPMIVGEYAYSK